MPGNKRKGGPSKTTGLSWKRKYLLALSAALGYVPGAKVSNNQLEQDICDAITILDPLAGMDPELPDSWSSIVHSVAVASGVPHSDLENVIFARKYSDQTGWLFRFDDMPDRDSKAEDSAENKINKLVYSKAYFNKVKALATARKQNQISLKQQAKQLDFLGFN
jgi:hypothetical protein